MNIRLSYFLKLVTHSFTAAAFSCGLLLSATTVNASVLKDYQKLNVYGVQQSAPTTIADMQALLDSSEIDSSETKSTLHRFLVYDALRQYLGFLLHINRQPGIEYFNSFEPLGNYLQGDFAALQRDAAQTAINISRELRFDVSLVQLSTKEIYNKDQAEGVESQIEMIVHRLTNISNKLENHYPESRGELPPILLAYVSSVFTPKTEAERISCAKKFSEEVKSDVFRILATRELEGLGQLLQSPVIYNYTPMGGVSSKAKQNGN